jgi:hypothetical protein
MPTVAGRRYHRPCARRNPRASGRSGQSTTATKTRRHIHMPDTNRIDFSRAIYIDIESLKTDPPHCALVGVLTGTGGEELEQLIVDPRLAPARVAKRDRLRVAIWPGAVEEIVTRAVSDDRRIVGWSNFDRDRMAEARSDLRGEIHARYVNALEIARPWRRTVHPGFKIERADQFAPKHTLDKYARLAGYEDVWALEDAAPATWIRHTLRQLEANEGRYRRITPEAKRDWHKLLAYNRHDLFALRHVVLAATRELTLWRAYDRTRFCVQDRTKRICFMAGSQNRRLDALLTRHGATRWAFITAWNPGSRPLSKSENARRHAELRAAVTDAGLEALDGEGVGEDASWPSEQSLLILNISRGKAISLGRRFGQLAIVVGRRGEASTLVATSG